jgi:hypothetical protein
MHWIRDKSGYAARRQRVVYADHDRLTSPQ